MSMNKLLALVGLSFALVSCAEGQTVPTATFNRPMQPKLALDVQTISLTDRTNLQPANSPYNSNTFSPTISEAVKQWASDSLQAVGQNGNAIVVIKDATLTAQPLTTQSGMESWFTRQQSVKYVGRVEVSLEANGANGFAMADGNATRSVTLPEDPTPAERQDAYTNLLNGLMKDLSRNLDSAIRSHMGGFIVRAPVLGSTAVPDAGKAPTAVAPQAAAPAPQQAAAMQSPVPPLFPEPPTAAPSQSNVNQASQQPTAPESAPEETAALPEAKQLAPTKTAMADTLPVASNGAIIIPLSGPTSR
jgi:hypothetical protein